MSEIDSLEVRIAADASEASRNLDILIEKLSKVNEVLSGAIGKVDFSGLTRNVAGMQNTMASSIKTMSNTINNAFNIKPDTRGITRTMGTLDSMMNAEIEKASKNFMNAFAIDPNKYQQVFGAFETYARSAMETTKAGKDLMAPSMESAQALGKIIQQDTMDIKVLDQEAQRFIDTIKTWGQVYVSPATTMAKGLDWRYMDGLLKQKINSKGEGISLDSVMQELQTQFPQFLKGLNLDSEENQLEALANIMSNLRQNMYETEKVAYDEKAAISLATDSFYDMGVAIQYVKSRYDEAVSSMTRDLSNRYHGMKPFGLDLDKTSAELEKDLANYTSKFNQAADRVNNILKSENPFSKRSSLESAIRDTEKYATAMNMIEQRLETIRNNPQNAFDSMIPSEKDIESLEYFENELARIKNVYNSPDAGNVGYGFVSQIYEMASVLESLHPEAKSLQAEFDAMYDAFSRIKQSGRPYEGYEDAVKEMEAIERAAEKGITAKQAFDAIRSGNGLGDIEAQARRIVEAFDFTGSGNAKTYFFELRKFITDTENALDGYKRKAQDLDALGVNHESQRWQQIQMNIERARATIDKYTSQLAKGALSGGFDPLQGFDERLEGARVKLNGFMQGLVNTKLIIPTDGLKEVEKELDKLEAKYKGIVESIQKGFAKSGLDYGAGATYKGQLYDLEALRNEYDRLIQKQKELSQSGYQLNGSPIKSVINGISNALQKFFNLLGHAGGKIGAFASHLRSIIAPAKSAKKQVNALEQAAKTFSKTLTRMTNMFKLMLTRMMLRSIIKGIGQAFKDLAVYSDEFNASLSALKSSTHTLNNSFAAMVAPLLNAIAPAIIYVINLITQLMNVINQLFSALGGGSTWIKATALTEDYAASLDKAGSSAKKSLASFDELNNLSSNSGGGGEGATNPADMFTTEEIDSKITDFANKVKDVMNKLFDPLKKAWDSVGSKVMKSWEKALKSVWQLVKDIGSDFLEVWNEAETVAIFENILEIVSDIGLIIANLADQLDIAWNKNEVGKRIFQDIRDILGIIIEHIKSAADYTVDWSSKIDFYPLLEAFEVFVDSLKNPIDALAGTIEYFYENTILKFIQFMIEDDKGLPRLFKIFEDFNNAVDWNGLENNLNRIWTAVEPLLEAVWTGLMNAIDGISKGVANFINSQAFADFCDMFARFLEAVSPFIEKVGEAIGILFQKLVDGLSAIVESQWFKDFVDWIIEWFNNVSAEDIANMAISIGELFLAFEAVKGLAGILVTLTQLKLFLGAWGTGGTMVGASGEIAATSTAIGGLFTTLATGAAIYGANSLAIDQLSRALEENGLIDNNTAGEMQGLGNVVNIFKDDIEILKNSMGGLPGVYNDSSRGLDAYQKALEEITNGMVYTDEQLSKMKENWGLNVEYIEDLRQAMFDANPEIADIADKFGLWDASVETCKQIKEGLDLIKDGTVDVNSCADEFKTVLSGMNDDALEFFQNLQDRSNDFGTFTTTLTDSWLNDFANECFKNAKDAAQNTVDGYNEGINEFASTTKVPVQSWQSDIEKDIHDSAMKYGSPSQTAKEFGEWTVEGYNAGIEENIETSKSAITSWMDEIFEAINEIITVKIEEFKAYFAELFSADMVAEMLAPVQEGISLSWESIREWFGGEAIPAFMETEVAEAFNTDKWTLATEGMKLGIIAQWDLFVIDWTTKFNEWWTTMIEPFFSIEQWTELGTNMKEGLYEGFKGIVNNIGAVINGMIKCFNSGMSKMKDEMNKLIDSFNKNARKMNTETLSKVSFSKVSEINIPSFKQGGFPEDGLFYANHSELVGQFNGKTAVANNAEIISGIKAGVAEANSSQNEYLKEQNDLLRAILEKETGISSDDLFTSVRKSARQYYKTTGNPAF